MKVEQAQQAQQAQSRRRGWEPMCGFSRKSSKQNGFVLFIRRTAQRPETALSLVSLRTPRKLPNGSEELLVIETFGAVGIICAYSKNWRQLRQSSGADEVKLLPPKSHFTHGYHICLYTNQRRVNVSDGVAQFFSSITRL